MERPVTDNAGRGRVFAAIGVVAFIAWQAVNVLDGVRYFFTPHKVRSYQEYGEDLGGKDIHRRYNVFGVTYDCASIRASTIEELEKALTASMRQEQPQESDELIDDYLVAVEAEGRHLLVRYYGRFDGERFTKMLKGTADVKSHDAMVMRSLFSRVTLLTGPISIKEIEVVPLPSPCDRFVGADSDR